MLPSRAWIGHGIIMTMRRAAVLVFSLTLAGCATRLPPRITPPMPPPPILAPMPPPAIAADWRDLPLSAGSWRYVIETNGDSSAVFGQPGTPDLVLRCIRAQRLLTLNRRGVAAPLTVRTSSSQRTLTAALDASDRFLDELAFSRGHISVEAKGLPMLVMPAWAEPARVIEDCRG